MLSRNANKKKGILKRNKKQLEKMRVNRHKNMKKRMKKMKMLVSLMMLRNIINQVLFRKLL